MTKRQFKTLANILVHKLVFGDIGFMDFMYIFENHIVYEPRDSMNQQCHTGDSKSKNHRIYKFDHGFMVFRMKKHKAKLLGINPFHKRKYVMKSILIIRNGKQKQFLKHTGSRVVKGEEQKIISERLLFMSTGHKNVYQFELYKFLMLMDKLDPEFMHQVQRRIIATT